MPSATTHAHKEQICRIKPSQLKPDPKRLMERFAADKEKSSLLFGFIHGSMVYSSTGALNYAYKEIRVHDRSSEEVVGIDFEAKTQPPDIDIVAIVADRAKFEAYFNATARELGLSEGLNYFLTLNIMMPDTLHRELQDARPRALRRILLYRPTWSFGDAAAYKEAHVAAKLHEDKSDAQFQREFEDRKLLLKGHLLSGARNFSLSPADYQELFPMLFEHLANDMGGFPEDRDKYVLPHGMGLKAKRYLGTESEEQLR